MHHLVNVSLGNLAQQNASQLHAAAIAHAPFLPFTSGEFFSVCVQLERQVRLLGGVLEHSGNSPQCRVWARELVELLAPLAARSRIVAALLLSELPVFVRLLSTLDDPLTLSLGNALLGLPLSAHTDMLFSSRSRRHHWLYNDNHSCTHTHSKACDPSYALCVLHHQLPSACSTITFHAHAEYTRWPAGSRICHGSGLVELTKGMIMVAQAWTCWRSSYKGWALELAQRLLQKEECRLWCLSCLASAARSVCIIDYMPAPLEDFRCRY